MSIVTEPLRQSSRQISWLKLLQEEDPTLFFTSWMGLLVEGLEHALEAVFVLGPADRGPFLPVATWPHKTPCSTPLQQLCEQVLEMRRPLTRRGATQALVAIPVFRAGNLIGSLAVGFGRSDIGERDRAWLYWGMGWLLAHPATKPTGDTENLNERLIALVDLLMAALADASAKEAYQSVLTQASVTLSCDRVTLGLTRSKRVRLAALSQSAEVARRIDLTLALEAAMNEAVDQASTISFPVAEGVLDTVEAHRALASVHGNPLIVTVPFFAGEDRSGALVFEWAEAVDAETIGLAEGMASIVGRVLLDKAQADQSMIGFVGRRFARGLRRMFGPRYLGRKLIALIVLVAVTASYLSYGEFRIAADARLEGAVHRTLAAPLDGFVSESFYRAGHTVAQGTVIARLDDRDLRLELTRWLSQRAQHEREMGLAQARRDSAQAQIAEAQMLQAAAQLTITQAQLERTTITAPFDGLITEGDLSQDLGRAVSKGDRLFELAPVGAYRLILDILERDLAFIQEGQHGSVVFKAFSEQRFDITIELITPVTEARDGQNVFRVEARLDDQVSTMRPGLEGLGRISVGEARWVWIWTRNMQDWLRLQIWKWFGV